MSITGLHHITLVTADAARNVDFYTRVLGLRLVKRTVNFDDPGSYHLYFGDETGRPGTAVTFFEWPGAPRGKPGIGGTHHFALTVADRDGLRMWKRRLTDLGVRVDGPLDRFYFESIYFRDPDGTIIEIATRGPGIARDEPVDSPVGAELVQLDPPEGHTRAERDVAAIAADSWPEPVPVILPAMRLAEGMHHISAMSSDVERTHEFFNGVLGLPLVKKQKNFDDPTSPHWYWGFGEGNSRALVTYFGMDPVRGVRARMGAGQTHHFALAVPDEATQLEYRDRLLSAGLRASPVMERVYFKSVYTQDPDGHIIELATAGPGFLVDEPVESLGSALQLPPWLEGHRARIERSLAPLDAAVAAVGAVGAGA